LLSRYRQQQDLRQTDLFSSLLITDYMFQKDRLFAYLNLEEKELSLYNKVANLLEENITNPDLVIYLQADTDRLLYNIRKRARDIEAPITRDYIEALNKMYNEFFFHFNASPLLIINATEIDFVENPDDLEDLIKTIRQPVTGTRFLNPIKHWWIRMRFTKTMKINKIPKNTFCCQSDAKPKKSNGNIFHKQA